jgi:hypothetical protein
MSAVLAANGSGVDRPTVADVPESLPAVATDHKQKSAERKESKNSRRKPKLPEQKPSAGERFFLSVSAQAGTEPTLGREIDTEAQAILEAFREGKTFFIVLECRVVPDTSGKTPQLGKELVSRRAASPS